jgi:hypothetical protein
MNIAGSAIDACGDIATMYATLESNFVAEFAKLKAGVHDEIASLPQQLRAKRER